MKFTLLLLLVMSVLVGCQQRIAVSCDSIQNAMITEIDFDAITKENISSWIYDAQSISGTLQIETAESNLGPVADVAWETTNEDYQAKFEGEHLVKVMLFWDKENPPTGTEIINCIGAPEYYQADYIDRWFEVVLFYPQEGLILRGGQRTMVDAVPENIRDIPMFDAIFLRHGSLESIVKDAYPNNEEYITNNTHPWSGNWEDIEYVSQYK